MKRFLLRLTIISFPLIIFFIILELSVRTIPNSYEFKMQWMNKNCAKVETLILGTSHTHQIDPESIPGKTFNLAHPGQSYKYDLFLLQHFIPKMDSLNTVITSLASFSYWMEMEDFDLDFRIVEYIHKMGYDEYDCFSKYYYELTNFTASIEKLKSFYIYKNPVNKLIDTKTGRNQTHIGEPILTEEPYDNIRMKLALHQHTTPPIKEYVEHLAKIAQLCETYNVKLVIVTAPVTKGYLEATNEDQLATMYKITDSLQQIYKNIEYLNLINDSRFIDSLNYFYDADHLSEEGIERFSQILGSTLHARQL